MTGQTRTLGQYALLSVRLYLGWSWIGGGWGKLLDPGYHGQGAAVAGFLQGALKTSPFGWYKSLIETAFLPNAGVFAFLVTWGELLVGIALLFGLLTNLAALFAILMNTSFLLAGTVSTNATYIVMELFLIFAASGLVLGVDAILARRGFRVPLLISDLERAHPPAISWIAAAILLVLSALALGVAGVLKLPEFSNPAGQLSRVLFFAAVMYSFKAVHDRQRTREAQPIARGAAA
jgi:thiosulfate dehydrogenase [quinone] large subunit